MNSDAVPTEHWTNYTPLRINCRCCTALHGVLRAYAHRSHLPHPCRTIHRRTVPARCDRMASRRGIQIRGEEMTGIRVDQTITEA